jgi:hypothetical protein
MIPFKQFLPQFLFFLFTRGGIVSDGIVSLLFPSLFDYKLAVNGVETWFLTFT